MPISDLPPIARTLFVPLTCRALEAQRSDTLLPDRRAWQVYNALDGSPEMLMGLGKADQFTIVLRARQFDRFAADFLNRRPASLVVDIGCGLDTRFDRLDDGQCAWLGLDLPEVITLRRQVLPDSERCTSLSGSMFDLAWLDEVARVGRPVIFLAEGVFPYFTAADVRPLVQALAGRFPGGELVFDATAPFISRAHNRSSSLLRQLNLKARWDVGDPLELESWGLRLIDRWFYFDEPQPRLGLMQMMRFVPFIRKATGVFRYRLGG